MPKLSKLTKLLKEFALNHSAISAAKMVALTGMSTATVERAIKSENIKAFYPVNERVKMGGRSS